MSNSILFIEDLQKSIKKTQIVQSFSTQLHKGEVLALCGGNGAGKSTVLRMVAGILRPSSGTVHVCGLEWLKNKKAYAEQIGYMPDDYQFGLKLTARESLNFYGELRSVSKNRAEEALRLVGLEEAADKQVSVFSKGMRQRLSFAQAILAKPTLLILDEPTNGLDPYWMESFTQLIRQMKKDGTAIIFSTHQLDMAETVADQVIFMDAGRVMAQGTKADFLNKYGSEGLAGAFRDLVVNSIR